MTTNEDIAKLVPDFKLCEKIPEGPFWRSCITYKYGKDWRMLGWRGTGAPTFDEYSEIPAPTSDEILEALRDAGVSLPSVYARKCEDGWNWVADGGFPQNIPESQAYRDSWGLTEAHDTKSPVNALLKLWFKVEGKDVERGDH